MSWLSSALFGAPTGTGLSECRAPRGRATILTVDAVDRTDAPGGRHPSAAPGRPAEHYLSATPRSEVPFEELFAAGSPFVLYSVEQPASGAPFVVFLALPAEARAALWQEHAFIDRGMRKLVAVGAEAAVASLETALEFAESALGRFGSGEWQLAFVWNTGRCGSTLMHKAVSAMGTASFSEPQWLDQLQFAPSLAEHHLARAVRACVALEALTARLQTAVPGWKEPTNFVFNPKAGGMRLAEAATAAFPLARHAFMYRACHKVVASFAGLKFAGGVPLPLALAWWVLGTAAFKLLGLPPPHPELASSELSSAPVALLTSSWLSTVEDWIDTTARRAGAEGPDDPLAAAIVVRMDEFTSKDPALRTELVRAALVHFRVVGADAPDSALAAALDAFKVNSQAGSKMSGAKAKVVSDADVEVIKRGVVAALGTKARVVDGGGNIVLARSLGVCEA